MSHGICRWFAVDRFGGNLIKLQDICGSALKIWLPRCMSIRLCLGYPATKAARAVNVRVFAITRQPTYMYRNIIERQYAGLGCATQAREPCCKPRFICNGNFALVPTLEAKSRPEFVEGRASGQERRWHGILSFFPGDERVSVSLPPLGCTLPSPGIIEFVLEHVDGVLDGLHLAHQPLQRQVVRQLHVRPARPGDVMLSFRSFAPFITTSPKFS